MVNQKYLLLPGARVVKYIRHSTDKQIKDYQERVLNEMIEKYNLIDVGTYYDPGKSAYRLSYTKRPELMKLLAAAEKGEFDAVIIYDWDRLGRNGKESLEIKRRLDQSGIKIAVAKNGILEVIFEEDILYTMVKIGGSQYEAANLGKRAFDARYLKAIKGVWPGGQYCYGISSDKGCISFKPECVDIIKRIFHHYLLGAGYAQIARLLPEGSYNGKNWTRYGVEGVIKNPIYAGYSAWGKREKNSGSKFKDRNQWRALEKNPNIQPIISPETFEKAYEIYLKRIKGQYKSPVLSSQYLVAGLIFCRCGSEMKTKNQTTSYRNKKGEVKTYGKKLYVCLECSAKVDADQLDEWIWVRFKNKYGFRTIPQVMDIIRSMTKQEIDIAKAEMDNLKNRLNYLQKKIVLAENKIKQLSAEDGISSNIIKAVDAERQELLNSLLNVNKCLNEKQQDLTRMEELYLNECFWKPEIDRLNNITDSNFLEKKFLIRQFTKKIIFDDPSVDIIFRWELEDDMFDSRQCEFPF